MNWAAGGALRSEGGWTVRLPAGDVRLLGDGSAAGTRGWIEIRQLPRASPVLLLAAPSAAAHIARWLGTAAEAGEELTGIEGIPQGWRLFAAPRIRSDKDVRDAYPVLTFPLLTKIRLIGGIHADSSTEYFAFAPPRIRLEGELGDETVLTDGEPIAAGGPEQLSHFPASTPGPHTVELSRAGEVIARKSVWLAEARNSPAGEPTLWADGAGAPLAAADERPCIHGAAVLGSASMAPVGRDLPPGLNLTLLGRRAGEIARWPAEKPSWDPVWGITPGRNPVALYLGVSPSDEHPAPARETEPPRRTRAWRRALWSRRRRTRAPAHPATSSLWLRYQEAARNQR